MAKIVLYSYLGLSVFIWFSSLGYTLLLRFTVFFKPKSVQSTPGWPNIAVVIPVLNEEDLAIRKLCDIQDSNYPKNKMKIYFVDGGSVDKTLEVLQNENFQEENIKLICVKDICGKTDQVMYMLHNIEEEIIIFTDVDSILDPNCISELVKSLMNESQTSIVGAAVRPKSNLLEERIHWYFLNHIWWLEGEVFSCSGLSGVCYAVSRKNLLTLDKNAKAEDIHLGLEAGSRGFPVKLVAEAKAVEVRVPQTIAEFYRFRRRRGSSYLNELLRFNHKPYPPIRWHCARLIRIFQFLVVPWVTICCITLGGLLLMTSYWPLAVLIPSVFIVTAILQIYFFFNRTKNNPGIWRLLFAMCRYVALILITLISLKMFPSRMGPVGGKI